MKIIYLHQYFNTPKMNGGTRSYEMALRFCKAGHEVHMITSKRHETTYSHGWDEEIVDGIRVHWIPIPYSNKMNFIGRVSAFLKFAAASGERARKVGCDVIFATSTPLTIALPGLYASKTLKKPMVFEVRDLWPEMPIAVGAIKNPLLIRLIKWFEYVVYKNSEAVVALSPGMAKGVVQTGYPRERVHVIPNSCDIDLFHAPGGENYTFLNSHPEMKGGPLVVYAGTLGTINGVGYLVEIAAVMLQINSSIRFIVVGDGKEKAKIRKKAIETGVLGKNFWMIPPIPKSEMPALLSASTVTTSLVINLQEMWNNSANKFFDSLAAGRPIMINHEGWLADLIHETGAGIVIPADDAVKSAKMLNKFVFDQYRVEKAGRAAFHLGKSRFNRDDFANRLMTVLQTACDSSKNYRN